MLSGMAARKKRTCSIVSFEMVYQSFLKSRGIKKGKASEVASNTAEDSGSLSGQIGGIFIVSTTLDLVNCNAYRHSDDWCVPGVDSSNGYRVRHDGARTVVILSHVSDWLLHAF